MKYKVGDMVVCRVGVKKNGAKHILVTEPPEGTPYEKVSFQVISRNKEMESYMILLDDDLTGWTLSDFHIVHLNVAKAFKGKKFYEITEISIVE